MKKKLLTILLILAMLLSAAPCFATSTEPQLEAESALLMDVTTGEILYEKESELQTDSQSLVMMMTCILTLENMERTEYFPVPAASIRGITGDKIGLYANEDINTGTLMSAMMVSCANDAASVLAIKMSGSIDAFVEKMNAKAAEIGLSNTHFAKPYVVRDKDQYTTAKDMAALARYCMQNEVFARIVARPEFTVPVTNKTGDRILKSTNLLLADGEYKCDGCSGIITGGSQSDDESIAASATRGDTSLLAIVMNSKENGRFADSKALLDWGFANFKTVNINAPESIPTEVKVKGGAAKTVAIDVPSFGDKATIAADVSASTLDAKVVLDKVTAPVMAGTTVGKLQVLDGDKVVAEYDITAKDSVDKKGGINIDIDIPDLHFGGSLFMKILLIILAVFAALVLIIVIYIINDRRKTAKRKAARAARRAQLESQESQLRKEWEKTYHGRSKDEF